MPGDHYRPHGVTMRGPNTGKPSGQQQFHCALHPIRIMAPGNGWGGTQAMGAEADAWCRHTNRWQTTPPWPIRVVWFCPEFRQFDLVRANLEEFAIGRLPVFREGGFGGPRYEWPDGSKMYLASYDRSWTHIQGIELDLCCFDEQPPLQLYREILQRRRGRRKVRVICKATQTKGLSWMAEDIYQPWLDYHRERGLDEEEAMQAQLHPDIWLWPRGSCHDNPGLDAQDDAWYEGRTWSSKKEARVRLWGGFESWAGDPVFDEEAIEWLRSMQDEWAVEFGGARTGMLVPVGS